MRSVRRTALVMLLALLVLTAGLVAQQVWANGQPLWVAIPLVQRAVPERYVVLAWNDLGMHCYNPSFQDVSILPPYNTLYAQVILVGNPPRIVTQGVTVHYDLPDNTYSVGKTNFWSFAQQLFGVALADNVGLTGKGLAGTMDVQGNHFAAEGIPLTEYRDSAPTTPYPYQLARVIVRDASSGRMLAETRPVAPVSTEMHCNSCHYDGGVEDIATGRVETNILTLHDRENADEYPAGHTGPLMARRPINCSECHSDNALAAPGVAEIPSFSKAMHGKHDEEVPSTLNGCYQCHPGPQTQCLRDVMSQGGMVCSDCHGTMAQVAQNPSPWLNEPRCDSAACHGSSYAMTQPLYRHSTGHGSLYCAACHDSPHAIAPSRESNDGIKFVALQGSAGPLRQCSVCHSATPAQPGPHGLTGP